MISDFQLIYTVLILFLHIYKMWKTRHRYRFIFAKFLTSNYQRIDINAQKF